MHLINLADKSIVEKITNLRPKLLLCLLSLFEFYFNIYSSLQVCMALSPPSTPSSSSSNNEKSNHTRLCRLLVDIGRQVLQDVFDRIHPPATLAAVLTSTPVQKVLKKLKAKGCLYQSQRKKLFPTSGAVTSADFDITLLFLLLRNICHLKPPATGWNGPPAASDLSKQADIVRIKLCRNDLYAHIVDTNISDALFESLWNDVKTALVRLGGSRYEEPIQHLLYENLDPDSERCFNVLLKSWEEGEEKILEAVRQLHVVDVKNTDDKCKYF